MLEKPLLCEFFERLNRKVIFFRKYLLSALEPFVSIASAFGEKGRWPCSSQMIRTALAQQI
ncbi:hypothetical protein FXE51_06415 [Vibrio mimicus]|uniref:Uncharacterized protein n=1 Tax=Vibrio mimicus TaxID=674 RepID=A0A2J9V162_VIBMI|nr:hypothetical protein AL544_016475 [Vibrio mimicus]TXX97601.1 hypothetical protein FXF05_18980 [Vibrio mimicus]TXY15154.1 hypothetical protein FXE99_02585 [Vibrio mimicus]TXY47795.1 hypothetical protein FXE78_02585 [Vibrio mimicus]TXZ76232.1 hypothetical protein FXE51_06415 [Vibrio mimicus]